MKICTIVGARPQFIKAAAVSRAITVHNRNVSRLTLDSSHLTEILIHTGQHYDEGMSSIFFQELEIPEPKYNLAIGSGLHGKQTGQMLAAIEKVLLTEKPDWVLIYGDTNSTLAGALAAAKLHIPVAHVEAGLRSFNRRMPEEINRVVADHLSTLLFCPSQVSVGNLAAEGISSPPLEGAGGGSSSPIANHPLTLTSASQPPHSSRLTSHVLIIGDVMADALNFAAEKVVTKTALKAAANTYEDPAAQVAVQSDILARLGLKPRGYLLATLHRAENTDNPERLKNIMDALSELARQEPVILPLHPRTKKILADTCPSLLAPHSSLLTILDPVGYFDIIALEKSARVILTDSGGMQKEAYWLKVPCVTMRDETEWVETVETGWNILTGADHNKIIDAARHFTRPAEHPPLYGDGHAAEKIIKALGVRSQA